MPKRETQELKPILLESQGRIERCLGVSLFARAAKSMSHVVDG